MTIGLTHTGNSEKHQFYIEWLKKGGDITIVELSVDKNNLDRLSECDALILSGGIDVHPRYYGSDKLDYPDAPSEFKEARDEFEMAAFQSAQENDLPVLGICRGLQLINVIHHGTLYQNLGDRDLNKIHKGEPDKSHQITVEKNTILFDVIKTERTGINSAHHQSIDKLGEGLMVNARSDEGIIEGIERKDKSQKPFLLAVQWHPERMFRFHLEDAPASKALREKFIEEVKKSIAAKQ